VRTTKLQALEMLSSCLRGELPEHLDWFATIALANQSMTTAVLAVRIYECNHFVNVPNDVRIFLAEILARNADRNSRLLSQMNEAVCALNNISVTPVLLKGAAILVSEGAPANKERMMSDIDMLVKAEELSKAVASLEAIGYRIFDTSNSRSGPITLARTSDVGMIDLHTKPRGPTVLSASDWLYESCTPASIGKAQALIPSATFQLLHFVLHDQFHNRDYWKGHLDLRHLCDMSKLIANNDPIDWDLFGRLFTSRSATDALATQLIQVSRLLSSPIPEQYSRRILARIQYRRCLAQFRSPSLRLPFLLLTVLTSWGHRNRDASEYNSPLRIRFAGRIRGTYRLFYGKAFGKI
jgi:Uncharacterised nucleotidyltransferase